MIGLLIALVAIQGVGLLLLTAEAVMHRRGYYQLGLMVTAVCEFLATPSAPRHLRADEAETEVLPGLKIRGRTA